MILLNFINRLIITFREKAVLNAIWSCQLLLFHLLYSVSVMNIFSYRLLTNYLNSNVKIIAALQDQRFPLYRCNINYENWTFTKISTGEDKYANRFFSDWVVRKWPQCTGSPENSNHSYPPNVGSQIPGGRLPELFTVVPSQALHFSLCIVWKSRISSPSLSLTLNLAINAISWNLPPEFDVNFRPQ